MANEGLTTNSEWEKELIDVIGVDALITLEQSMGGRYVYIHAHDVEADIAELVGNETAEAIRKTYAGTDIYIPTVLARKVRNQNILKQHRAGLSIVEIADQTRLSAIWVKRILKGRENVR